MTKEEEYIFSNDNDNDSSLPKNKKKPNKMRDIGRIIWNHRTREFLGRDGASWAKITLFYAVFYLCLASFFVLMLAVFGKFVMPWDKPTYYGESSVMNQPGLNPGLGFRPQPDVEDHLIKYNPLIMNDTKLGYQKYITNMDNFLNAKYSSLKNAENLNCTNDQSYVDDLKSGKSCRFEPNEIFKNSPCTSGKQYGFNSTETCVLIKINKIVSWIPKLKNSNYISVNCSGEHSADRDNLISVTYHSENSLNNKEEGQIPTKYFPFFSQSNYQAPFIWAVFEVQPNTLVDIVCKAWAENIDNMDRVNRRGQTRFSIYRVLKPSKDEAEL